MKKPLNWFKRKLVSTLSPSSKAGYVVVRPHAGLGNRLGVVISFQILAEKLNKGFLVYWDSGKGFDDTAFYELFDIDFGVQLIDQNRWEKLRKTAIHFEKSVEYVFDKELGKAIPHVVKKLDFDEIRQSTMTLTYEGYRQYARYIVPGQENIKHNLSKRKREIYQRLRPSKELQQVIDKTVRDGLTINEYTYGCHIRRGDAAKNKTKHNYLLSSDELFENMMKQLLIREPKANFFLATDCEETLMKFRQLFGNKLSFYDKTFVESNIGTEKKGQKDAAIELFLLSQTRKIFGTNWSTFSRTASLMGNIPLEIVKPDET